MTITATSTPATPEAPRGLLSRIVGVFFSPRATFAEVAARPRALGVLAVGLVVVIVGLFALFQTEVGQQAWIDQQVRGSESFGRTMTDQQIQGMERIAPYMGYIVAGLYLIFIPIVVAVLSAILLGVFNALLGGDATFKQVFAVVSHAGLVTALQTVFAVPLDYARETLSSPTNLGVFLPFLDEMSLLGRLLGMIDLFQIWWIVTLSIGLAVLYKRKTGPIATSLLSLYFVIVLAIAAVRSALS
jgi:Yip1-like protein